ncbi:MAG: zinc ribbon domain-containing protein [Pyrinomonadaceae bacterium]|nr:zinc ribbon domain-containing protein [Pyrinomonadaceae bacterium]
MPIYEYKCSNCENKLETMQKISDEPLKVCPKCGAEKLEKQWSLSGFQFKGSGWYVSDYTNRNIEPASETKSETKTESKSESGDAKSATSTESVKSSAPESTSKSESASNTTKSE